MSDTLDRLSELRAAVKAETERYASQRYGFVQEHLNALLGWRVTLDVALNELAGLLSPVEGRADVAAIRQRLVNRRAPHHGKCTACGHEQDVHNGLSPAPGMLSVSQWTCQKCGAQIVVTLTVGDYGIEPSPDDDVCDLLDLVSYLSTQLTKAQQVEKPK